jgi:hypothetical protein
MKNDPAPLSRRRDDPDKPGAAASPATQDRARPAPAPPGPPNSASDPPLDHRSVTTIGTIGEILADADPRRSFGPMFFASQLRVFVRDCCGGADDHHPVVQVLLADGALLDLCHVIGVASGWVALAVRDEDHPRDESRRRTELVPYRAIERVTIKPQRGEAGGIGFSHRIEPRAIGVSHMAPVSGGEDVPTNGLSVATHEGGDAAGGVGGSMPPQAS